MDEIGRDWEKKILVPNFVRTQPEQENSKKIAKKIQKLKNLFPALFLAKMGGDRPKKRKEKILSRIPFILGPGKKILKKIAKKFKKLKKLLSSIIFSRKGMR